MRLDKYLASNGFGSRDEVKRLIRSGRISVNGMTKALKPEMKVSETDVILLDGKELKIDSGFQYFILNKPQGYITARNDPRHRVVMELIPSKRKDLSPVGRLDEDTEGLLLVTDDGDLNHRLLSPKNHIEKTYYLEVDSDIPSDAAERLSVPIEFKEFTSQPAGFSRLSDRSGLMTVTEGKFHEVKRLMHHIGCEVTFLKRVRFGPLELPEELKTGEVRELTTDEVTLLTEALSKEKTSEET